MEKDWVHIYTSSIEHQAQIVQAVLADNEIKAVLMNKKDSAYTMIGDVELYVNSNDVLRAKHIIKENEL